MSTKIKDPCRLMNATRLLGARSRRQMWLCLRQQELCCDQDSELLIFSALLGQLGDVRGPALRGSPRSARGSSGLLWCPAPFPPGLPFAPLWSAWVLLRPKAHALSSPAQKVHEHWAGADAQIALLLPLGSLLGGLVLPFGSLGPPVFPPASFLGPPSPSSASLGGSPPPRPPSAVLLWCPVWCYVSMNGPFEVARALFNGYSIALSFSRIGAPSRAVPVLTVEGPRQLCLWIDIFVLHVMYVYT